MLSGLEPDKDIRIAFTGMRPGEKLYEELFRDEDVRRDTGHPDIFAAVPEEADLDLLRGNVNELRELCTRADTAPLLAAVKKLVFSCKTVHGSATQPSPCPLSNAGEGAGELFRRSNVRSSMAAAACLWERAVQGEGAVALGLDRMSPINYT